VDEVLSVGDYGFQQRCLGKMQEQTDAEGRTVVFVSHNLGAVSALTRECMCLDKGTIQSRGATEDVFVDYLRSFRDASLGGRADLSDGRVGRLATPFLQHVIFDSVELQDREGTVSDAHVEGEPLRIRLRLDVREPLRDMRLEVFCKVSTLQGVLVFTAAQAFERLDLDTGLYETSFAIDPNPLAPGTYSIELRALSMSDRGPDENQDIVERALTFHVQEIRLPADDLHFAHAHNTGVIRATYDWDDLSPVQDLRPVER
jgi:lipopolysaccharide transport system ATP-binding protein